MTNSIKFKCVCSENKILKVPEKYAGKKSRCPSCGKKILIPPMEEIRQALDKDKYASSSAYNEAGKAASDYKWEAGTSRHRTVALLGIVLLAVVAVAVFFIPPEDKGPMSDSMPLVPKPPTIENEYKMFTLTKLENMPDKSSEDLEKKLTAFEKFFREELTEDVFEKYQLLRKQKKELKASESYQKLPQQPLARIRELQKLAIEFPDTLFVAKKAKPELEELKRGIKDKLLAKQNELKEILGRGQLQTALLEILQQQIELNEYSWWPEIAKESNQLVSLGKDIASNLEDQDITHEEQQQEQQLEIVKQNFYDFLATYRDYEQQWRFPELVKEMKPLVEQAESLQKKYPKEESFQEILRLYEEAEVLSELYQKVTDNIQKMQGKEVVLFLKGKAIENGTVVGYQNKHILLQTEKEKEKKVALNFLKPTAFVNLALKYETFDPQVYRGIAHFYKLTNQPKQAKDFAEKAIELGVKEAKVQEIVEWSKGLLSEKQQEIEQLAAEREEAQLAREEKLDKWRSKNYQRRGQAIIDQMMLEYKKGLNIKVLNYLIDLKNAVPRAELIKLSKKLGKEEGFELDDICDTVYNHCPTCNHDGELTCPTCSGDGYLENERRVGNSGKSSKQVCPTCRGEKTIVCPVCKKKKENRTYELLDEFYGDL